MQFKRYLDNNNLDVLTKSYSFNPPVFTNEYKVYNILRKAKSANKRILIVGDCDVDGAMSALIVEQTLTYLGFSCVDFYTYKIRDHKLSTDAVIYSILEQYDVVIILDTGSNDIKLLYRLIDYGIEVIVLDHHKTDNKFEDYGDIAIVNPVLEPVVNYRLSAGALSFCVMSNLCTYFGKPIYKELSAYALVSLYADCVVMNNELNISIYQLANSIKFSDLPYRLKLLMGNYRTLSRKTIEFSISPIVNSCFRAELFDVLNAFLFNKEYSVLEVTKVVDLMIEIHQESSKMVNIITDCIRAIGVTEIGDFIFFDLANVAKTRQFNGINLEHYTGLIANKISSSYKKTALVIFSGDNMKYKGSLRDYLARPFLPVFKQICEADGHDAAFGFYVSAFELGLFKRNVELISKTISMVGINMNYTILNYVGSKLTENTLKEIANYNEFSGTVDAPQLVIKISINKGEIPKRTKFGYTYKFNDMIINSGTVLANHNDVSIIPYISNKLRLQVKLI